MPRTMLKIEEEPLKYQMWAIGEASLMWPILSRRTAEVVISTPQRSQTIPL